MSTVARPTGPLPPRVYWVRRLLVLTVLLGLVFGVAQLLGRTADGGPKGGDTARVVGAEQDGPSSSAPSPTAASPADDRRDQRARQGGRDQKPERGGGEDGERDKSRKPKPTKTPLAEPSGPCESSDVVVTPKVRGEAHAGSRVRFRLLLTTAEAEACTWRVSPRSLVVKLTSGDDRIWSSQDCPTAIPETEVVVRKDHPAKVGIGWRGQRSDSACSRTTPWAEPGWYHIEAAAFGADPTSLQFELQEPVPPTITPKPKPERDKDRKRD